MDIKKLIIDYIIKTNDKIRIVPTEIIINKTNELEVGDVTISYPWMRYDNYEKKVIVTHKQTLDTSFDLAYKELIVKAYKELYKTDMVVVSEDLHFDILRLSDNNYIEIYDEYKHYLSTQLQEWYDVTYNDECHSDVFFNYLDKLIHQVHAFVIHYNLESIDTMNITKIIDDSFRIVSLGGYKKELLASFVSETKDKEEDILFNYTEVFTYRSKYFKDEDINRLDLLCDTIENYYMINNAGVSSYKDILNGFVITSVNPYRNDIKGD